MAGSLNHIIAKDGTFRMGLIENMRDAREALEEAHQLAAWIAQARGWGVIQDALTDMGFPQLTAQPVIQPELHGPESVFRHPNPAPGHPRHD
jgi:hypothetical protein